MLPLALGTGPTAAPAGPRACAEMSLARGGAASTFATSVGAGRMADKVGGQAAPKPPLPRGQQRLFWLSPGPALPGKGWLLIPWGRQDTWAHLAAGGK